MPNKLFSLRVPVPACTAMVPAGFISIYPGGFVLRSIVDGSGHRLASPRAEIHISAGSTPRCECHHPSVQLNGCVLNTPCVAVVAPESQHKAGCWPVGPGAARHPAEE